MPATQETTHTTRAEAKSAQEAAPGEEGEAEAAAPKSTGGLKAWLPLIITVATMPVLAFATTRFILLPKMEYALAKSNGETATDAAADSAGAASKEDGKGAAPGKTKVMVPMSKMLVNVAGTMGTRYLMTSVTLVGNTPDFKNKIEENKDQLLDLAANTLSTKTISDLEKPGARNVIRSELITVLNNALGGSLVQEIYITELAIQ
jgi:flagellar protein FliL